MLLSSIQSLDGLIPKRKDRPVKRPVRDYLLYFFTGSLFRIPTRSRDETG